MAPVTIPELEAALGFRYPKGLFYHPEAKQIPQIRNLLRQIVEIGERILRHDRQLAKDRIAKEAYLLFTRVGSELWPDPSAHRPPWLFTWGDQDRDPRTCYYPKDLHYSDPDDLEVLRKRFERYVRAKCMPHYNYATSKAIKAESPFNPKNKKVTLYSGQSWQPRRHLPVKQEGRVNTQKRRRSQLRHYRDVGEVDSKRYKGAHFGSLAPPRQTWASPPHPTDDVARLRAGLEVTLHRRASERRFEGSQGTCSDQRMSEWEVDLGQSVFSRKAPHAESESPLFEPKQQAKPPTRIRRPFGSSSTRGSQAITIHPQNEDGSLKGSNAESAMDSNLQLLPMLSTLDIRVGCAPESPAVVDLNTCLSLEALTAVLRRELRDGAVGTDFRDITISREGGRPIVGDVMSLPVRQNGAANGWRLLLRRLPTADKGSVHLVGRVNLDRAREE